MQRTGNALQIVLLCISAAVLYGILHDQVTVRVCLEYFTIGHLPIFGNQPPTLLAILWGTVATWWLGLILGGFLALVSCAGPYPIRSAGSLVRPILMLILSMAVGAVVAGVTGYCLASEGIITLSGEFGTRVDSTRHANFLADAFAHDASYLIAIVGGLILMRQIWRIRKSSAHMSVSTSD